MSIRNSDGENVVIRHNPLQQGALVTIIIFLVGQTFGWGWWAATTTERLRGMSEDMSSLKGSVGNYVQVKTDLASLEKEFIVVRDNGSPITDRRLTLLEYKLKELIDKKFNKEV